MKTRYALLQYQRHKAHSKYAIPYAEYILYVLLIYLLCCKFTHTFSVKFFSYQNTLAYKRLQISSVAARSPVLNLVCCSCRLFTHRTPLSILKMLISLVMVLTVSKLQCQALKSEQPFIYQNFGRARVNFFIKQEWSNAGCMEHCQKLGSRSPPVRTLQEWRVVEGMVKDLVKFTPSPTGLYLPVTRGEVNDERETFLLKHWPKDIRKEQGQWRDYYTGQQLENYNKTWKGYSGTKFDDSFDNCAGVNLVTPDASESNISWQASPCTWMYGGVHPWCPCQADDKLKEGSLLLRGLCSTSNLRTWPAGSYYYYRPQHEPTSFDSVFFQSDYKRSRIDYNKTSKLWVHSSRHSQTIAVSSAENETYVLGKYNWTFSKDHKQCHQENGKQSEMEDYSIELKLSGCKQGITLNPRSRKMTVDEDAKAEFTCNDGQCVGIEKRCDQLPDCVDGSDEEGCKLFSLAEGYRKVVPPYAIGRDDFFKTFRRTCFIVSVTKRDCPVYMEDFQHVSHTPQEYHPCDRIFYRE